MALPLRQAPRPRRPPGLVVALALLLGSSAEAAPPAPGDPPPPTDTGVVASPAPVLPPRIISWDALTERWFDPRWILPEVPPTVAARGDDLAARLAAMLERRLPPCPHHGVLAGVTTFGDLARRTFALADRPSSRREVLDHLAEHDGWSDIGAPMRELLRDERLTTERWDPDDDDRDDGLLTGPSWSLDLIDHSPWSDIDGRVHQVATLIRADLDAIKCVENDWHRYADRRYAAYEWIHPVPGTHFRGVDGQGRPWLSLQVAFRCDLPWPFGGYECRLAALIRPRDDGALLTDFHAAEGDFEWMAGRDVCLPVTDSRGEWVATLLVRSLGFDLDGVPDGDGDRRQSMRGILGNIKWQAEALFARRGHQPRTTSGAIPDLTIAATGLR